MSLEANKILGAVLLSGVLAMTAGYGARILSSSGGHGEGHGGHGAVDDSHGSGLAKVINIPVTEGATTAVAAVAAPTIEPVTPLLASASIERGEKVAKKCSNCHTFEEGGKVKQGPNLWSTVNRPIASAEGFKYSAVLAGKSEEKWTPENLNGFLKKPKKWAPKTKMNFPGLKKVEDRAALIAYMQTLGSN